MASTALNVKYAYAIEIGPTHEQLNSPGFNYGFSVHKKHISRVAEVAYYGIYQYMRSFLDKTSDAVKQEVNSLCSELFEDTEEQSLDSE